MEEFEIIELTPLSRRNVWRAVIGVKYEIELDGAEMASGAKITVRFSYDDTGSVEGLLEAAFAEAKRCVGVVGQKLDGNSLGELLDVEHARREELRKPFELSWPEETSSPSA